MFAQLMSYLAAAKDFVLKHKWMVLTLVGLVLVFMSMGAGAQEAPKYTYEARANQDWIRISAAPCTDERVLGVLNVRGLSLIAEDLKAAATYIGGKNYAACWMQMNPESVGVIYEDGDTSTVPVQAFELIPEA